MNQEEWASELAAQMEGVTDEEFESGKVKFEILLDDTKLEISHVQRIYDMYEDKIIMEVEKP